MPLFTRRELIRVAHEHIRMRLGLLVDLLREKGFRITANDANGVEAEHADGFELTAAPTAPGFVEVRLDLKGMPESVPSDAASHTWRPGEETRELADWLTKSMDALGQYASEAMGMQPAEEGAKEKVWEPEVYENAAQIPATLLDAINNLINVEKFTSVFTGQDLTKVTLYGEGYGSKIQNGGKYRVDNSFVLSDVQVCDWWL